jgi:tetratricopeptide (TPR) repeat protein
MRLLTLSLLSSQVFSDFFRSLLDSLGTANALKSLGDVLTKLGTHDDAHNQYNKAIELYRHLGNRLGEANSLLGLGRLLDELNNHVQALRLYEEAAGIYKEIGNERNYIMARDQMILSEQKHRRRQGGLRMSIRRRH